MSSSDVYEVYAVKYAVLPGRTRGENFLMADEHDGPMPMDYFVWAIVNDQRTILVDTGFAHEEGQRRGRQVLRTPAEGLALLGIDAQTAPEVIITHLHYDHAGTLEDFPAARFHVQAAELAFATGPYMTTRTFRRSYTAEHVCTLIQRLFDGRVTFNGAEQTIAPGVSVHFIGGHTAGMQSVRVKTRRGWVVLASDACHYYENLAQGRPYPTVFDVGAMVRGWGTLARLAETPRHIVPGHDPLVLARYPAPNTALEGIVARLDADPRID